LLKIANDMFFLLTDLQRLGVSRRMRAPLAQAVCLEQSKAVVVIN